MIYLDGILCRPWVAYGVGDGVHKKTTGAHYQNRKKWGVYVEIERRGEECDWPGTRFLCVCVRARVYHVPRGSSLSFGTVPMPRGVLRRFAQRETGYRLCANHTTRWLASHKFFYACDLRRSDRGRFFWLKNKNYPFYFNQSDLWIQINFLFAEVLSLQSNARTDCNKTSSFYWINCTNPKQQLFYLTFASADKGRPSHRFSNDCHLSTMNVGGKFLLTKAMRTNYQSKSMANFSNFLCSA